METALNTETDWLSAMRLGQGCRAEATTLAPWRAEGWVNLAVAYVSLRQYARSSREFCVELRDGPTGYQT
jgi:hypothetical protein